MRTHGVASPDTTPAAAFATWRTFLTNHLASAVSIDLFTVPTLTGRVLFVLVVLSHLRRRIVHVNVTDHPTATWAAQQVVDAFPEDTAPRWLHRDRDGIYGDVFQRRLAGMGIVDVVSAPASPWQNPYVERLIGSIVDPSGSISSGRLWTASEPDILRRPQAYSRYRELCIPPVFRRSFSGK